MILVRFVDLERNDKPFRLIIHMVILTNDMANDMINDMENDMINNMTG